MNPQAPTSTSSWIPLELLRQRFTANAQKLRQRDPALAEALEAHKPSRRYHIQPLQDRVLLGVANANGAIEPLPQALPPQSARNLVSRLYPAGQCDQPVLVVGEDLGWLWNNIYQLPCNVPSAPGHRPPLYFLIADIERLWVMLHVQDWQAKLADPRVAIFVGKDAFEQFRAKLGADLARPWPKLSARIDSTLWPPSVSLDQVLQTAREALAHQLIAANAQIESHYCDATPEVIASRSAGDRPLNILGITSRYTTFLQHSMRDWLRGFERLGHRTQLLIESADHEVPNAVLTARTCAEFEPDLIVIIDHFRREIPGLPEKVPVAMWVQDALPNIFNRNAGAAQGARDYALGFARLKMVHDFGYPAGRYMSAIVACNDERFAARDLSASEKQKYACDVSFVSHASTPAHALVQAEIERLGSVEAKRLFTAILDRLQAEYDAGGMICEVPALRRIIDASLIETRTGITDDQMPALVEFFGQKVNNALFRHQSLLWLAEMDVDLRLYGNGWERHPKLARFARGPAENSSQLPLIYRASKINLQMSPHGAVHQRVLEGLAAGGFFMMRYCPGDVMEREFAAIWEWCRREGICDDVQLRMRATPDIAQRLQNVAVMLQQDPFAMNYSFIDSLRSSEEEGYVRSAGMIWGEDYDAISYRSAEALQKKVRFFLANECECDRVAESMRKPVMDRFTYVATSRRLLQFIARDLAVKKNARIAA